MAILKTLSVTMTDAEFLTINGAAAPNIPVTSPFTGIGITAASSAGTTTITLQTGKRTGANITRVVNAIRRAKQVYNLTQTI